MIKFAEPTVEDLTDALSDAIPLARKVVPSDFHAKASQPHLHHRHRHGLVLAESAVSQGHLDFFFFFFFFKCMRGVLLKARKVMGWFMGENPTVSYPSRKIHGELCVRRVVGDVVNER